MYYNARYYDPVTARFVSADIVQNNSGGFDPYAYVRGNPETFVDPSGHDDDPPEPIPPLPDDPGPNWGKFWLAVFQNGPGLLLYILMSPGGAAISQHAITAIYQYVQQNTGVNGPSDSIDPPPTLPPTPPKSGSAPKGKGTDNFKNKPNRKANLHRNSRGGYGPKGSIDLADTFIQARESLRIQATEQQDAYNNQVRHTRQWLQDQNSYSDAPVYEETTQPWWVGPVSWLRDATSWTRGGSSASNSNTNDNNGDPFELKQCACGSGGFNPDDPFDGDVPID